MSSLIAAYMIMLRRTSHEVRGLKSSFRTCVFETRTRRTSHEVRGLKLDSPVIVKNNSVMSHLTRGAWIEIIVSYLRL